MIYYFAYGSNLHPVRLSERVASANLIGIAQLPGYQLRFHKLGQDDSGKCNLHHTATATDIVHGAVYSLAREHKRTLDEFEGKGKGYKDQQINIMQNGQSVQCFTYLAQEAYIFDSLEPYHWYKQLVLQGAIYLRFPETYLSILHATRSCQDPLAARRQTHHELLEKMRNFPET